jgi:hypothetical protein
MKRLLPYAVCIAGFYLITIFFFYPEIIGGRSLVQSDAIQFLGMSNRSVEAYKKTGEVSLWNDALFGGMPDYLVSTPIRDLPFPYVARATGGFFKYHSASSTFFISLTSFFILLLAYGVHPYLAALGALVFGFGTYNIINLEVGHTTKMWAISYAAIILAGLRHLYQGKYLSGLALAALGASLEVRSGHYQITYYFGLVCLIYAISEFVFALRNKTLKNFAVASSLALLAGALGLGVAAGKLMIVAEYNPYSMRGGSELKNPAESSPQKGLDKDYAFAWSQGIEESLTLLIPNYKGGSSNAKLNPSTQTYQFAERVLKGGQIDRNRFEQFVNNAGMYWGDQPFTAGPLYAGAIVCFLFVFSMLILDDRERWWILGGFLLTLFLAWGKNFSLLNYFLFDYIPGFNKFRSVSMALGIGLTLMPFAAILALQKVLTMPREEYLKKLYIAAGATSAVCVLVLLASTQFLYVHPQDDARFGNELAALIQQDRQWLLQSDALRSLAFVLLATGLIFLSLRKTIALQTAALSVAALMALDLFVVAKRYIYDDKFEKNPAAQFIRKTPADEKIFEYQNTLFAGKEHYRVLGFNNPFNEAQTAYFHRSVGGYHPVKMSRYQDLIERQITPQMELFVSDLKSGKDSLRNNFSRYGVLNMLNARYFKGGNRAEEVFINDAALGEAWMVSEVVLVNSPDEEINRLSQINTASQAVFDASKYKPTKTQFEIDSNAVIKLSSYHNRHLVYDFKSSKDALVVFSEIYYEPGWELLIDGKAAPILRANYVLRAAEIPAGNHKIEMHFNPSSYAMGNTISTVSAALVSILALLVLGLNFRQQKETLPEVQKTSKV